MFMVTVIVPEMDDAIDHYTRAWGFSLERDDVHVSGHRWVELGTNGGIRLRLAEASDAAQRDAIGRQAGGRVAFFLNSPNFDVDVAQLQLNGITVLEPVRTEHYGRIVVLADKYGNRWDLIEAQASKLQ
ncbi:MAG: VOC family protein [Sphingopyxis sp.]|nr:VOC family protein [Sphingopyxis sp.]